MSTSDPQEFHVNQVLDILLSLGEHVPKANGHPVDYIQKARFEEQVMGSELSEAWQSLTASIERTTPATNRRQISLQPGISSVVITSCGIGVETRVTNATGIRRESPDEIAREKVGAALQASVGNGSDINVIVGARDALGVFVKQTAVIRAM